MPADVGSPFGSPEQPAAGALRDHDRTGNRHFAGSPSPHRGHDGAKITVALDDDLDDDPADETLRSGIGGTGHAIELGDRGRLPANIVQRYHATKGGRRRRPGASLTRTHPRRPVNDAWQGRSRPHMPMSANLLEAIVGVRKHRLQTYERQAALPQ